MRSGEIYAWWNKEGHDMPDSAQICILLTEIAEQLAYLNKQVAIYRGVEKPRIAVPRVQQ